MNSVRYRTQAGLEPWRITLAFVDHGRGFAITALGIDEMEASRLLLRSDRPLTERAENGDARICLPASGEWDATD